jgi:hypothetical protein
LPHNQREIIDVTPVPSDATVPAATEPARFPLVFGLDTFGDVKYGMGGLSHEALMTNIELYGVKVIPLVRELLA